MNLLFFFKTTAVKEKAALVFLLKLLLLMCVLKCIFFLYNYNAAGGWDVRNFKNILLIIKWSLLYDVLIIAITNVPLFIFLLIAPDFFKNRYVRVTVLFLVTAINTFSIFLNTVDIFYFRFHLQRADADMLYVIRNPFANGTLNVIFIGVGAIIFCMCIGWFIYRHLKKLIKENLPKKRFVLTNFLLLVFLSLFFLSGTKKLLPTYPLTQIEAVQLPLAQNSFHSFIYSMYRRREAAIPAINYMPAVKQQSLFSIRKKNNTVSSPKNIVLFIMESVPLEFFDSSSPYKTAMPFLDSLVNESTFFSNAFSYSYSSNKGITAILAGLPTITDIPLYHSNYTSINRTSVGAVLAKNNYSSAFFIGDNYDDFGFAKCSKWLGIQQYYSMQDIPGYKQMEKHSLGLHDEYVLNFMQQQINKMKPPFLAVQYNISTHYPNDLPKNFKEKYPGINTTPPMKSMQYYNDCLQQFFKQAALQPWYSNTVFIFCSDHWAQPFTEIIPIDKVESFRIPLFIYEPSREKKLRISAPVSQLDIVNTILHFGGIKDSFISYGVNLTDSILQTNRTVFTKINSALYQAINNEFVLGFNAIEGKEMYCYAYKKDPGKKNNLVLKPATAATDSIILQMKAFLQTASNHYRGKTQ